MIDEGSIPQHSVARALKVACAAVERRVSCPAVREWTIPPALRVPGKGS